VEHEEENGKRERKSPQQSVRKKKNKNNKTGPKKRCKRRQSQENNNLQKGLQGTEQKWGGEKKTSIRKTSHRIEKTGNRNGKHDGRVNKGKHTVKRRGCKMAGRGKEQKKRDTGRKATRMGDKIS